MASDSLQKSFLEFMDDTTESFNYCIQDIEAQWRGFVKWYNTKQQLTEEQKQSTQL